MIDDTYQEIVEEALDIAIMDATYESSWFVCEFFACMTCDYGERFVVDVWPTYMLN